MNSAQVLVDTLVKLGATQAFGVPGESYLSVLDAFLDHPTFRFTQTRHEGAASFAAEAWGKLTGQPGICFVTRGPGATNASIGVHTAMQASMPMLLFVGQIAKADQDREMFQEVDYRALFGGIAKWVTQIDTADRTAELVARAWKTAVTGRPGPVVVALPEDILGQPATSLRKIPSLPAAPCVEAGMLDAMARALNTAQRPLILAGGGGWTTIGTGALAQLVRRSNIPVAVSFRCHDLIDNHMPQFIGEAGVGMALHLKEAIAQADVILALGIRFGEMTTDAHRLFAVPEPQQKILHVHPCADELNKILLADLSAAGDPGQAAAGLLDRVAPTKGDRTHDLRSAFVTSQSAPCQQGAVDMAKVTRIVQSNLPHDAIVTHGAGNFAIWADKFMSYGANQQLLAPQSGAMGYGVPAALAACIAYPDRRVVCFAGDGDFQMTCNDLGTALQEGLRPIILILNNGTYGTIRMHQERDFPNRISGTDIVNPDFPALARCYGMYAERVEATADFATAFARACASETGAVLDIVISAEAITPRTTLTQLRRDA